MEKKQWLNRELAKLGTFTSFAADGKLVNREQAETVVRQNAEYMFSENLLDVFKCQFVIPVK